jgi:hypothetical protein
LLTEAAVKQIAHDAGSSQTTRLLLCLAVGDEPKSIAQMKTIAANVGISGAKNWNISQLLSASKGKAINTPKGWELSTSGKKAIELFAGPLMSSAPPKAATSLRSHLGTITNPDTQSFVEQAISCLEHKLYRAAVVLSWVGALALIYDHVVKSELAAFNAEAKKRDGKWKDAKNQDDLSRMKEYDFLQIVESISVIGKNVKTELEACLKLRNGCGHPNSLTIGESRTSAHIEVLTLNVFAKF